MFTAQIHLIINQNKFHTKSVNKWRQEIFLCSTGYPPMVPLALGTLFLATPRAEINDLFSWVKYFLVLHNVVPVCWCCKRYKPYIWVFLTLVVNPQFALSFGVKKLKHLAVRNLLPLPISKIICFLSHIQGFKDRGRYGHSFLFFTV